MRDPKVYDVFMLVVAWFGIHQGVYPFVAKGFDLKAGVSLPLRLDAPLWWITAALAVLVAIAALVLLDNAKKRLVAQQRRG